jgi:hypothetical protein
MAPPTPQRVWEGIQDQTDDSDQEVDAILATTNNFIQGDDASQFRRVMIALTENGPTPNKAVWHQQHEVVPDGAWTVPHTSDFIAIHDIMPTTRVLSDLDYFQNALHLYTDLDKDVSRVIASYAQSPVGRVTLVSNGMSLFSEDVLSFPHTGTFASVLPVFLLTYSHIVIKVTAYDTLLPLPFTASIKYIYVDAIPRDYSVFMFIEVRGYDLIVFDRMLVSKDLLPPLRARFSYN